MDLGEIMEKMNRDGFGSNYGKTELGWIRKI